MQLQIGTSRYNYDLPLIFSHACYISYIEDWWLLPLGAGNNKFLNEGLNGVVAFTVID